jgi:5-methylcytosine-specific restriction endonuclease McrA
MKEAWVSRGVYRCNGCKQNVPVSVKSGGKLLRNVFVDHINPIVDPIVGFKGWDVFINNLFCEPNNLQVLCGQCHDTKTAGERKLAVERRKTMKNGQQERV